MRELSPHSAANDIMKYVNSTYEEMRPIFLQYDNSYCQLHEDVVGRIVKTGYGIGTTGGIHRGCYTPSLLFDILVGNCNRGRPAKRMSKNTCYQYGFDKNGFLISSESFYHTKPISWERVINEPDYSLGLCYKYGQHELASISEEFYNKGRLEGYHYYQPHKNHSLVVERYWYKNNQLDRMLLLIISAFRLPLDDKGGKNEPNYSWITKVGGQWCFDFQIDQNMLSRFQSQTFSLAQTATVESTELYESVNDPCEFLLKKPKEISFAPGRPYRQNIESPEDATMCSP